jgi:hypothetical protein
MVQCVRYKYVTHRVGVNPKWRIQPRKRRRVIIATKRSRTTRTGKQSNDSQGRDCPHLVSPSVRNKQGAKCVIAHLLRSL